MAEQPSQASCKEFSRLCPAASYRQIVENGQRGIGIAFQRPNRIPRLRPRIQTKVALQVSMPGFAVAGMQADPTSRLVAKQRRSPLARSGRSADRTRWNRARTGIARYTSPNPRRPKKATTISPALPDGANSSLIAAPPCFSPRIAVGKPQELVPVGLSPIRQLLSSKQLC